jgi:hypothetical protein
MRRPKWRRLGPSTAVPGPSGFAETRGLRVNAGYATQPDKEVRRLEGAARDRRPAVTDGDADLNDVDTS